jgi:hypothetical protein
VITEILVEDSRGVFKWQVVRMISMRVPVFTDVGLYLVGSLIICERLRASSLDCRTAGVLSITQFRSPNSRYSEDKWGAISSHMVSRAQLVADITSGTDLDNKRHRPG